MNGIAAFFALTIIVLIFNMVFYYYLGPLFLPLIPASDTAAIAGVNRWLTFWKFIPYLIMGSLFLYMLIRTAKTESVDYRV
jgi:hypothetical protein